MLTREAFNEHLREALNHLYDPDRLCHSPLARLFGVADQPDTPSALQRILIRAIESLAPPSQAPAQSRAWRLHDLLLCRYIQQISAQQVANQLNISIRHLRREQIAALETLGHRLWEQFHLHEEAEENGAVLESASHTAVEQGSNTDLRWLQEYRPHDPLDLQQAISGVAQLAGPLAAQHGVRVKVAHVDGGCAVVIHPIALRQILLSLLSSFFRLLPGGDVEVSACDTRWGVDIKVRGTRSPSKLRPDSEHELTDLAMAHRLAELSGSRLILAGGDTPTATLTVPGLGQLPVLVIEDSDDFLELLKRYTQATRYRLFGVNDPRAAVRSAEEVHPQIIVLDVMMPQTDGWEVLGWLRQHPLTSQVPIIVCTVLSQEELALSLGASDFVQKPVTQQVFLAALDRQLEHLDR